MADKSVIIEGIADGAFGELPGWATEKTALELEKHLRKSFDVQAKMLSQLIKSAASKGTALTPEEVKKVSDEIDKWGKSIKRNNEEDAKAFKRKKERNKLDEDGLVSGKKKGAAESLLTTTLSGLTTIGGKVLGTYKEYIDVYDALYTSGINVLNGVDDTSNGFEVLNRMVNLTGVSLETFQKVANKYSSSMNVVGVQKFSRAVNLSTESFRQLGYSSEQQLELMAAMMESEVGFMRIQNKSAVEIAKDAENLGSQLDKLSKVVGMSREQLQENIKESNKSANAYLIEFKYGIEARQKFTQFTAAFPAEMKGLLEEALAVDSPEAQASLIRDLHAATLGDIAPQIMMAIKQGAVDPEQGLRAIKEIGETLQKTGRMRHLASFVESQEGKRGAELLALFSQMSGKVSIATDKQVDSSRKTQESVARFNTEVERLTSTLQAAFMPLVSQVNDAAAALKALNDVTRSQIANTEAETRSWIGIGIAIAGVATALILGKGAISSVFSGLGKLGPMLTNGVSVLKYSKDVLSNSIRWLGSKIPTLGNTIKSGATSIGAGLKGVFSYISGIILNAGKGLASSVFSIGKKLLGPAALFGVAALGGAAADTVLGKMGVGGKGINEDQDDLNWQRMSALEKMESGLARGIEGLGKIFFLDNLANEAAAERIKNETEYLKRKDVPKNAPSKDFRNSYYTPGASFGAYDHGISTPYEPAPTYIINTSDDLLKDLKDTLDSGDITDMTDKITKSEMPPPINDSALGKQKIGSDINNLLSYQGSILEQILLSTNDLVSVNKDILRYARNGV